MRSRNDGASRLGDQRLESLPNQPVVVFCLPRITEVRSLSLNNTRQGYVRKDTLKLAGFLFLERPS